MSRLLAPFVLFTILILPLGAQTSAPVPTEQARQDKLASILEIQEPGQQLRALESFAQQYPKAPELGDVYNAVIQDAVALNDDNLILVYNLKLEQLDPGNLAQRVKVLNLLLLETDAAHKQQTAAQAATFARMVEAKTQETPPKSMGPARWRLDMARLRSLAGLFQGAAAQALGQYPQAEKFLVASLQQSQTEEAAQHLGDVYVALGKLPQAVDAYALALALPGQTIPERAKLEQTAGGLYAQIHNGSRVGFGDLILQRFGDVAARDAEQQQTLHPNAEANANATTAGQFVLTALDGAKHSLTQEKGKVVVLDFWATWCGPCKVQHPLLAKVAGQFANNHDVTFIAINEDEERSRVVPFLDTQHWKHTTWLDAGLGAFLGVESLPTTMILNPEGLVVYRQSGFIPGTFVATLHAAIERALKASDATAAN